MVDRFPNNDGPLDGAGVVLPNKPLVAGVVFPCSPNNTDCGLPDDVGSPNLGV